METTTITVRRKGAFEPRIVDLLERNKGNLNSEGVYVEVTEKGLKIRSQTEVPIETLILVSQQILYKGNSSYHKYELIVLHHDSFKYEKLLFHEDKFLRNDFDWLCKRLGLKFAGSNENLAVVYNVMRKSVFQASECVVYNHIGWLNDGELSFIYGNLRIDSTGRCSIKNEWDCLNINDISITGSCEFVKNESLNVLANDTYAKIILCYGVLSGLKYPITKIGRAINFTLYIYGETGTGKTTVTFAMLNPFDAPSISVNDSAAAAMEVINCNKCGVTIFDDVKNSKGKQAIQILEEVIRISGDNTTSAQRKRGNFLVRIDADNLLAVTAEIEPPLQTSSFPRLLILEFDRSTANVDNLRAMERNIEEFKRNNIAFILHFVQYVLSTPNKIQEICKKYDKEVQRQRELMDGLHGRYYNILAWVIVTWREVSEFCQSNGVEFEDDGFESEIQDIIVRQHKKYSPQSPAKMFCQAFFYLIDCGTIHVVDNATAKGKEKVDVIAVDGIYQIRTKIVYEKVKQFYLEKDIDFPYSERRIREELLKYGLILKSKNQATLTTDNRRIGNKTFSYFSFCRTAAENFLKEDNSNE